MTQEFSFGQRVYLTEAVTAPCYTTPEPIEGHPQGSVTTPLGNLPLPAGAQGKVVAYRLKHDDTFGDAYVEIDGSIVRALVPQAILAPLSA
jgi:hypothetical protein